MFQKILLAVDGTDASRTAAKEAVRMAGESGGRITAVYVKDIGYTLNPIFYSMDEIDRDARKVFSYVRSEAEAAGVDVDYKVTIGHAINDIVALSEHHDVVVCGTNGRTGVRRYVYGSVSESLSRMARCSTVVVHS